MVTCLLPCSPSFLPSLSFLFFLFYLFLLAPLLLPNLAAVPEKQKLTVQESPVQTFPLCIWRSAQKKRLCCIDWPLPLLAFAVTSTLAGSFWYLSAMTAQQPKGLKQDVFLCESGWTQSPRRRDFSRAWGKVWDLKKVIGTKIGKGNCKIKKCLIKNLQNVTLCSRH